MSHNGGWLDGRVSTTNHCTALNEGAPLAANAYNIILCVSRVVHVDRWSGPLYHSITIVTEFL